MLPPNTVPITAEELLEICEKPLYFWVKHPEEEWKLDDHKYSLFRAKNLINYRSRVAIAVHDYRHYFGEVVDLGSKMNEGYLDYLGCDFRFEDDETVWRISNTDTSLTQFKGTEQACKQWLIDHFTAIVKKDLPHLNIKFIFS